MSLKIYRDADIDPDAIRGFAIAVIGYGNQGRAHALNLRSSGFSVAIGQRLGKSYDRAVKDGFAPRSAHEAAAGADLIILTLPDELAPEVYEQELASVIGPDKTLGFVHGFNIRFGFIAPPDDIDVIMVAPKGPGTLVRSLFKQGKGLPALVAVHRDASGHAMQTALGWASGIGAGRAAVMETTFAAETETDLFGEQAVLCGGVTALAKAAFETLVEAGYEPEFAYIECVHELKQVVDLLYAHGLSGMRERISNTAEYGDLTRGPALIADHVKSVMRKTLEDIRNGTFAKEWMAEHRSGGAKFRQLHDADVDTLFEKAGKAVRGMMPWL